MPAGIYTSPRIGAIAADATYDPLRPPPRPAHEDAAPRGGDAANRAADRKDGSDGAGMKREFTSSAAWSAAASWIEQAAAGLIFLVIARLIGVESFGIAAMAFAFLFLGEFLVRDTVTEAIVARETLEDGRLEATFVALSGFAFLIMLVLLVIARIAALLYDQPQVAPLLSAASPVVLMIGLAGVSTALLRRRLAFRALAIRTVLGVLGGGAVGIALALSGFGAWSLVGQRLTEIAINSALAFAAAGWRPQRWPGRADFALLRGLGPQVVRLRVLTLIINQTPTVMLGIFADPRAAGLFAFAWRLAEIVHAASVRVLQGVAQAAIAALRRQGGRTARFYLELTELAAFAGFLAYAGLALVADPLATVLLGPDWAGASPVIAMLCLASACLTLSAIQEAYLLALDRLRGFLTAVAIEAAIGLAVVGLASAWGPVAAAGAVALRALAMLPLRSRAALQIEAIAPAEFLRSLIAPALLAAGMALTVGAWRLALFGRIPDPVWLAGAIAIGIATAAALLFGLMPRARMRLASFLRAQG